MPLYNGERCRYQARCVPDVSMQTGARITLFALYKGISHAKLLHRIRTVILSARRL